MKQSYERNIKPLSAASRFLGWLCPVKMTINSGLNKPESLLPGRPRKTALGCWFHQILFWDFSQSWQVIYQDLAFLSQYVIFWGLAIRGKSSSGIRPIFKLTFRGLKNVVSQFDWTKPSQKSLSRCKWFHAPLVRLNDWIFFFMYLWPTYYT